MSKELKKLLYFYLWRYNDCDYDEDCRFDYRDEERYNIIKFNHALIMKAERDDVGDEILNKDTTLTEEEYDNYVEEGDAICEDLRASLCCCIQNRKDRCIYCTEDIQPVDHSLKKRKKRRVDRGEGY